LRWLFSSGVSRTNTGPGRAQRKGKSAEGRATGRGSRGPVAGSRVGRYTAPEESGRYTRPLPRTVRASPRWYGPVVLAMLVLGVLAILLNYLTVLPGSVTPWYLVGGLVAIFVGFLMATRYR
jgi:hypothetical protein